MKLTYVIALLVVLIFLVLFFFKKNPRRFYLLFVFFFFPFMDLQITPASWGNLKVIDGISYFVFFALFLNFLYVAKQNRIYLYLLGLLIISLLIGSLTSDFINNSLVNILSILPIFIFSKSLIDECLSDNEFQHRVIWCLKAIAIFSILFLIVQMIIGLDFTFYEKLNRNTLDTGNIRYPSFFHDPQKYQQFLAVLSFLFLINDKQIEKPDFKNYFFFIIVIIAMMTTGGRSAFVGLFFGMLFLFFFLGFRYKIFFFLLCLISIILVISFSDTLQILLRFQTFNQDYQYRSSLWNEAYQIFKDNSFFGIGIGNFHEYAITHSYNYFINTDKDVIFYDQPESGYLMILSEFGAIGFILSFSFIITPVYYSIRSYYNDNKNLKIFIFIAAILSWLISFVSVYSLSDKRILIIVITIVCVLTTVNNSRTKHEEYIN